MCISVTSIIFHHEYEYWINSKYLFCMNTNTNLFETLNLARIQIWIYLFMPNIPIFEYFICLNQKELGFKEWKISSVATKITHNLIPNTKFYKKMSPSHKNLNDFGHSSKVKKVKFSSKYSNIFVRFLRIFEYIRDIKIQYSYSNIRYSAENIRIFEYIRIFVTHWSDGLSVCG